MQLVPEQISRHADPLIVEEMRRIYNASLDEVATKPLTPKSPQEQHDWWVSLDHDNVEVSLYRPFGMPWAVAAFSIVRDRGDHCTPFFCTNPEYRGMGIGRQIISHYLSIAKKPLHGEQLVSNGAIRHLNKQFGWQVVGTRDNGRVECLQHPGINPPYPDYKELADYNIAP